MQFCSSRRPLAGGKVKKLPSRNHYKTKALETAESAYLTCTNPWVQPPVTVHWAGMVAYLKS